MLSIDELKQRFESNQWPTITQFSARSDNECEMALHIEPSISWFEGHFPDQPVLAGVVQTHWAGEYAQALFPIDGEFSRIDNLKFQSVILPGQTLTLSLTFLPEKHAVSFRYAADDKVFSSGKLVFAHLESES